MDFVFYICASESIIHNEIPLIKAMQPLFVPDSLPIQKNVTVRG